MRLIIIRHGETEENINNTLQRHLSGKLTKKGLDQSKKLAKRLKNEKIDAIYSSDLGRAKHTTKQITKFHKNIPIIFTEELRERFPGSFQGKKKDELWNQVKNNSKKGKKYGIESMNEAYKRAKEFLKKIIKKHGDQNVLIIGHGFMNRILIAVLIKIKVKDIRKNIEKIKNTGIVIVEVGKKHNKVLLFNCTKHLD